MDQNALDLKDDQTTSTLVHHDPEKTSEEQPEQGQSSSTEDQLTKDNSDLSQVDLTDPVVNNNKEKLKISPANVWNEDSNDTLVNENDNPVDVKKTPSPSEGKTSPSFVQNETKENTINQNSTGTLPNNNSLEKPSNGDSLLTKPPPSPFFLKQLDVSDDIISVAPTDNRSSGKSKTKKSTPQAGFKTRGYSMISNESEKSDGSSFSRTSTANGGNSSNVKVVVRVRPFAQSETERGDNMILEFPGEGGIWIDQGSNQTKSFTFNTVFEEGCSQEKVFDESGIKELVEKALDGFSCTAFAFGQTGSGKTHTIIGEIENGIESQSGLVPRSIHYLFDCIANSTTFYRIRASYLEVYNEKVKDLLNPSNTLESLPIRWSTEKGFYVDNLFSAECETAEDLMEVLEEGSKYRQMGVHAMNDYSSRSHCMLIINMDSEEEFDDNGEPGFPIVKHGKISFVDLAGSERVKETKTSGETLTESNNINKSLLTLGNCISALGDPRKKGNHIPYRESKLTKLLADSLGGDGYTLMIACVSPSSYVLQDTKNTLRYANRAKNIKNKPVVKMDPREMLLQRLKRELKLLKAENSYFRQQLGVPYSEMQVALTPSQIHGDWTPNDPGVLSPAIGSSAFSSLQSSRNNSSKDVSETILPSKAESTMMTLNGKNGIYDILREFMSENENLKIENLELHRSRAIAQREQEEMSRENDRLFRKLDNLGRVMLSTPHSNENIQSWLSNQQQKPESNDTEKTPTKLSRTDELKFPPVRKGSYPNMVNSDSSTPISPLAKRPDKSKVESKIPLHENANQRPEKPEEQAHSPIADKVTQTNTEVDSFKSGDKGTENHQNQQQQQHQQHKNKKSNRNWRRKKPPPPLPEKPSGYAAKFAARKELRTKQRVLTTDQNKKQESTTPTSFNSYQTDYMAYNPYMIEPYGYDWNYNYAMSGPNYPGMPVYMSYPGPVNAGGFTSNLNRNQDTNNSSTIAPKRNDGKRHHR